MESYIHLGAVLEYGVMNLPHAKTIVIAAVTRLSRILDAEGNPLEIEITENLEQGMVKSFKQMY